MLILYAVVGGLLACEGCEKDKQHCNGICDCGYCASHNKGE